MTVWILVRVGMGYDLSIVGVYKTKELALDEVKSLGGSSEICSYETEEYEVKT